MEVGGSTTWTHDDGPLSPASVHDGQERLHLVRSLMRLEDVSDVVALLAYELAWRSPGQTGPCLCLFTHEVHLLSPAMLDKIEKVCRWARGNCVGWGFPADLFREGS
jgi:hypothetical protein